MTTMTVRERACRACRASLATVFDMGTLALSNFPDGAARLPGAPLDLCRCRSCGLVQLRHTVSPDALFKRYWYLSGVNESMRAELADVVADAVAHHGNLGRGDIVVDVGANDGTLLAAYPPGVTRVAFEPAENLQEALGRHADVRRMEYFPGSLRLKGSASILTSIACFYAVDDPLAFVAAVDDSLTRDGVWVVQFQDLHQMIEATAFDDVCHEHLFYPSLASTERMLEGFDLRVIDAQRRPVNGGSLRLTVGRKWRGVSPNVRRLRDMEAGCEDLTTLLDFAERAETARAQIRAAVDSYGGVVDLYGASTKGNMLLQFCGLGPGRIRQAWERSPEKWGRRTVTGIPIVSEDVGRADPPGLLLVVIWQFREAILRREASFGGRFLFPLPRVEVVDVREDFRARADAAQAG